MEYALGLIFAVAFVATYAAIIPYRKDFEKTVRKLERQTNARLRFY